MLFKSSDILAVVHCRKCSNVADSTHDAADGTNDDAADPDVTGRLVADPQLPFGIST